MIIRKSVMSQLILVVSLTSMGLVNCGRKTAYELRGESSQNNPTPIGERGVDGAIVRARLTYPIEMGSRSLSQLTQATSVGEVPIQIQNAESVTSNLDVSQFIIPSISSSLLSFGSLSIEDLFDNKLRICGTSGKEKCTKAMIRIYTTGGGAGLWNSADGYGAPLLVSQAGGIASTQVGYQVSGATVLQSLALDKSHNVLRNTDFTPAPTYQIQADLRNAGAGTYEASLVVEYVLAD